MDKNYGKYIKNKNNKKIKIKKFKEGLKYPIIALTFLSAAFSIIFLLSMLFIAFSMIFSVPGVFDFINQPWIYPTLAIVGLVGIVSIGLCVVFDCDLDVSDSILFFGTLNIVPLAIGTTILSSNFMQLFFPTENLLEQILHGLTFNIFIVLILIIILKVVFKWKNG